MLDKSDLENGKMGIWWLEENSKQQIAGSLLWNPRDGAVLNLLGSFGQNPFECFDNLQLEPEQTQNIYEQKLLNVMGEVDGTLVTLRAAMTTSSSLKLLAGYVGSTSTLKAQIIFLGRHITDYELAHVSRYEVSSPEYSAWINRTGVQFTTEGEDAIRGRKIIISGEALDNVYLGDVSNLSLSISHQIVVNQSLGSPIGLTERNSFIFSSPISVPFDTYREQAYRLHDLISVAAGRYLQEPSIRIRVEEESSPEVNREDVEVLVTVNENRQHQGPDRWIFRLGDGLTEKDLVKWLDMSERHRCHIRRLLITKHSSGMFMEDKINNVAAVLQGFGRDLSKDSNQDMLPALLSVFDSVDESLRAFMPNVEIWSKTLRNSRNDLAHHDSRAESTSMHLYLALYVSSFWLGLIAALLSLGVAAETIQRLLSDNRNKYELEFAKYTLSLIESV